MFRSCRMMAALAVALLAIALAAGSAEARPGHSPQAGGGKPAPVPATAVLDWNATAVATVRGAMPAKFQLESDLYMAYVQASVYDAVVSIGGRYEPYHAFASPVSPRGASIPAAVAAAAYTALAYYFPPQAGDAADDLHGVPRRPSERRSGCRRRDRTGGGQRHHRRAYGRRPRRRDLDALRSRSDHARRVGLRTAAVPPVGADAVARVHATASCCSRRRSSVSGLRRVSRVIATRVTSTRYRPTARRRAPCALPSRPRSRSSGTPTPPARPTA